ncbi:unnamed protein product [Acanthoscelides obtectus]|uniref:Uncharacterized protein n=1 Tax=Acanthoscelides obtectus TaxID=200917 RepID=A0A9P0VTS8_ACAOB|nr:unnamed protein product [Acanthoscelides obtectus]CAK1688696.1 hypothetical protein AOBTE_LOCUS36811 [Acanthoscelides obtectus]
MSYDGIDPTKKPRLPKLFCNPTAAKNLREMNRIIAADISDQTDFKDLHAMIYAGAFAVLKLNGQRPTDVTSRNGTKRQPAWERRLSKNIDNIRSDIAILTQYQKPTYSQRVKKKGDTIMRRYTSEENPTIVEVLDLLKQRLLALSQRVKRYKKSSQRRKQNILFHRNQRAFYKSVGKESDRTLQGKTSFPNTEDIRHFWSESIISHMNRGKKRKLKIDTWKQTVRKHQRDAGEAYISSRNVPKAALSQPEEERVCKCPQTPRGCNADLLVGRHVSLFQKFRKLHYDGQSQYLSQIISLQEPKRRRVEENISRRHCTVKYSINGTQVCRGTVCIYSQLRLEDYSGLLVNLKRNMNNLQDQRGKHLNSPKKLKNMDVGLISDHIRSFPLQENYYSRNTSAKQCLPADLNISKMFRLFKEKYPDANNISFRVYHDIFKSKFNLRFGLPRSDTCSYCDKLFMELCSTDDANEKKK